MAPSAQSALQDARHALLWVRSGYSFLRSASHPEELAERAARLGHRVLGLCDRASLGGLVEAWEACREQGLRLVVGAQVPVRLGERTLPLLLLAEDRAGYGNLCELLTVALARDRQAPRALPLEVAERAAGLQALAPHPALLAPLREAFGERLSALLLRALREEDPEREATLRAEAARLGVPLAATQRVSCHAPERKPLLDVLRATLVRLPLARAGRRLPPNGEEVMPSPERLAARFADVPEALRRSREVAERCRFDPGALRLPPPAPPLPPGVRDADEALRLLAWRGAERRYGRPLPERVGARLRHELGLVAELGVAGHFLVMHEVVRFCEQRGILCQGRGSAAGSVTCYALGITAIDPVGMDLLFERFLSRERAEPPDIDLDIEHQRREEVIQHVYARYGRRHAAMVATTVRYRARAAARDLGQALGLQPEELDRLARQIGPGQREPPGAEALRRAGLDPERPACRHLLRLLPQAIGLPRHRAIHPGGFLLGREPVDRLVPIEPAAMAGRTVAQWDKGAVEGLGLFKVDLLGLGVLSQLRRGFELLERHEGRRMRIEQVPPQDPAAFELLRAADTVGVFQVESRAQMAMLPRHAPRTFYDLVVQVALVRPGPIQGDMVHPYLRRRRGEEPVELPHPAMARALGRTLGVPIFQEQVMRLAIELAGYDPGEADQLRRDMAAWRRRGRIERHRQRLVEGMVARGVPRAFAERVFRQVRGFGEYGFPESHAASFALLALASAWLKAHHPAVFYCALLDAQPMGFYPIATIVEDARRHGVQVRPVDVQRSRWHCTLEPLAAPAPAPEGHRGPWERRWALRMGLRFVRGLDESARSRLQGAPPPYASLRELVARTGLSRRHLEALAEAGALQELVPGRREALWRALAQADRQAELPLAPEAEEPASRAALPLPALSPEEALLWDHRRARHSPRGHPMRLLRERLARRGFPTAAELLRRPDGERVRFVGLVTCRQRPGNAGGVLFLTLEDETGLLSAIVWPRLFARREAAARAAPLLGLRGRLQRTEEGVVHLVAEELWAEEARELGGVAPPSRDFH